MKRSLLAPLVVALAAATTAQAQSYDDRGYYGQDPRYSEPVRDVARVTHVEPIVERGQRPVQREECWSEEAPGYAYDERYDRGPGSPQPRTTGGGAVVGAIVGGALGNSVGSGDGRRAATVLGAVIGGTIGNNVERENIRRQDEYYGRGPYGDEPVRTTEVRRCQVVTDYRPDEQVVGYRVQYEYAGRTYETMTDYHPGSTLRVRVEVVPEG